MLSYSRKLKANTRRFMPEILWSLHFIQAQGYKSRMCGTVSGQHQHSTANQERKDVEW